MSAYAKKTHYVQDMTRGNPLRLILYFAVPLFIGNIFQQFYSIADTMVVGHFLGDEAIAAIGATASLYSLLINFSNGLNAGYTILVTQQFGAKDIRRMKQSIAGMIQLNLVIVGLLMILVQLGLRPLMRFLNTPEELFALSHSYIRIILLGISTTIGYNMFASILRAFGNSRSPLYFLILSSILNIIMDVLFVAAFRLGVAGAAAATVIAQAVSAIACIVYVWKHYPEFMPGREDFRVAPRILRELLATGISLALMSCLVDCGSVIFSRANNLLGQSCITAHSAARKILIMMIQPQATIAMANATFVGQNWGAGNYERIRATLYQVFGLEILWGLTASVIVYLFGAQLIVFTTGTRDSEVIAYAVQSLRCHFAAFPFLGVLFALRNALQSMGCRLIPVCSSMIELLTKFLSAAFFIPTFGFLATCLTEPITWVIMVCFLIFYYIVKNPADPRNTESA